MVVRGDDVKMVMIRACMSKWCKVMLFKTKNKEAKGLTKEKQARKKRIHKFEEIS